MFDQCYRQIITTTTYRIYSYRYVLKTTTGRTNLRKSLKRGRNWNVKKNTVTTEMTRDDCRKYANLSSNICIIFLSAPEYIYMIYSIYLPRDPIISHYFGRVYTHCVPRGLKCLRVIIAVFY